MTNLDILVSFTGCLVWLETVNFGHKRMDTVQTHAQHLVKRTDVEVIHCNIGNGVKNIYNF